MSKKSKKTSYGVDLGKKVTPLMVRDAMIQCFLEAHDEELEKLREYGDISSEKIFKNLKKTNVRALIKKKFEEVDGDFDKPSKDDLFAVMQKLKKFARNFRDQEIIDKHEKEIMTIMNELK